MTSGSRALPRDLAAPTRTSAVATPRYVAVMRLSRRECFFGLIDRIEVISGTLLPKP